MRLAFIITFIIIAKHACAEDELIIDRESIQATSAGGEFLIQVSSNHSWNWSSKSDWVKIDAPPTVNGDYKFRISIKPNNSSDPRNTTVILFFNLDDIPNTKEILISQQSESTRLELSSEERYISKDGGKFSLLVSSNTSWTWNNMPEWVTSNFSRNQEGNTTLTFNVNSNPTAISREATLSFYTTDLLGSIVSKEYLIRQGGGEPTLEIRNSGQEVPADGRSYTIRINSNANWTWNKSDLPNWITSSEWTQQNGNHDFRFTVLPNDTAERRNFRLNFNVLVDGSNLSDSYSISQVAGTPFLNLDTDRENISRVGGSFTLEISSNTEWNWVEKPNWITFTSNSTQSGNGTINYIVSPNDTNLIRQGLVIITSQGEHEPITRELSVFQEGSTDDSDQKPKIQSIVPVIKNGQTISMSITFNSSPDASYEIMYSKDLKSWDVLEKITAKDQLTESRIESKFRVDSVMFYKIKKFGK